MPEARRNFLPTVLALCAILAGMVTAVSYSPTLYRLFCAATGYGGTVRRVDAAPALRSDRTIKVHFDANVAPGLPWEFRPLQRTVETHFGEPTKVYYYARNLSDQTMVARATFNVTPYQAAPYFFKIQCFCFTDEKLKPGESAKMPLVLYLDEQMLKDEDAKNLTSVTLSYTFFRQKDLDAGAVARARDLGAGSRETESRLENNRKTASFDNDAPRR